MFEYADSWPCPPAVGSYRARKWVFEHTIMVQLVEAGTQDQQLTDLVPQRVMASFLLVDLGLTSSASPKLRVWYGWHHTSYRVPGGPRAPWWRLSCVLVGSGPASWCSILELGGFLGVGRALRPARFVRDEDASLEWHREAGDRQLGLRREQELQVALGRSSSVTLCTPRDPSVLFPNGTSGGPCDS